MKKYISIFVGLVMVLGASSVFAANDLTLEADTIISVGGSNYSVSTSVIDSITINSDNFVVTLAPGKSLGIKSLNRWVIATDPGSSGIVTSSSCNSLYSSLSVSAPASNSVSSSVAITPTSGTTCVVVNTGGGVTVLTPSVTPAPAATTPVVTTPVTTTPVQLPAQALPAVVVATSAAVAGAWEFRIPLKLTSMGTAVTELQKRLTAEGVYSGPITGYFGLLTQAAVKKYQAANGIDQLGNVGPATRAKLNASAVAPVSTGSSQLSSAQIEVLKSQLQSLQAQLLMLLSQQLQLLQAGQ